MEIIIGENAGFCFGVNNAVKKAKEYAKKNKEVNCLGQLVHNKQVTEELKTLGIKFIDNIEEAAKPVIIRAHGVTKETYKILEDKKVKYIDLTCPKVLKIHEIVKKYKSEGYYIFVVGNKIHPETIGTTSFCGEDYFVIENKEDVEKALEIYKTKKNKNSCIIAQTTYSLKKFNEIVEMLKNSVDNVEIKNTICNATQIRQEETEKISKQVELMIIIGGKNSSNSTKLYEIAKQNCKKTIFIETEEDIDKKILKGIKKIGIMAGASTPRDCIENVKKICEEQEKFIL